MKILWTTFLFLLLLPISVYAQGYEVVEDAEAYRNRDDMCVVALYTRDHQWDKLQDKVQRLRASGAAVTLRKGTVFMPLDDRTGCPGKGIKVWNTGETLWVVKDSMRVRQKVGLPLK